MGHPACTCGLTMTYVCQQETYLGEGRRYSCPDCERLIVLTSKKLFVVKEGDIIAPRKNRGTPLAYAI